MVLAGTNGIGAPKIQKQPFADALHPVPVTVRGMPFDFIKL